MGYLEWGVLLKNPGLFAEVAATLVAKQIPTRLWREIVLLPKLLKALSLVCFGEPTCTDDCELPNNA